MTIKKLLIATIGFTVPFTASTAALADDQWGDRDDGWGDDDDDWDNDDDGWGDNDDDGWGGSHGKKDVRIRDLQFIDKGERLVAFGELSGVKKPGYKPVKLVVKARGDALAVCIHPGGHVGKKPVDADEITAIGRIHLDPDSFYKGVADGKVATDPPRSKIPGAPDCPNWKWTEKLIDVAFTAVELDVVQDGKKLLELECYFDEPTEDGKVPRKQFDCEVR